MSLEKIKLNEVLRHRKGFITIDDNVDYKLCRVQLHRRGVVLREIIKGSQIRTKQQQVCKAGDFLIAEMDAKVGGYGFVPKKLDGAIVSSHYFLFELDKSKIRPKYLEVVSQLQILQDQIKAVGSTNYSAIRPANVLNWEIPITDLDRQKKIEKLFEETKEKGTELSTELIRQLDLVKKLRQQLLQDAVQGKLVKQVGGVEPACELLKKIKAEKAQLIKAGKLKKEKELPPIKAEEIPFEIPENWTWCRLGDVGHLKRGKSKHRPRNDEFLFKDGTFPFIQTGDVSKAKFNQDLITTINGYYNEFGLKQSEIQNKDTLCITIAANIAECGFLGFDACVPDSIVCFVAIDRIIEKYVYYYLKIAKEELEKYAPATAQKNINLGILNDLKIPLPPLSEQHRIVQKLEQLLQVCADLEQSIQASQTQNEQLLQQVLREALRKDGPTV